MPHPSDSPLRPHDARGGGGVVVSGPSHHCPAGLDPSIQNGVREPRPSARPVHARAEALAPPVFPRSHNSRSGAVREANRGLPAGERPGLGLRLLRKRQPPGAEPQPSSAQRLPGLSKANTSSRDAPGNAARLELSRQAARRTTSSDTNPLGSLSSILEPADLVFPYCLGEALDSCTSRGSDAPF